MQEKMDKDKVMEFMNSNPEINITKYILKKLNHMDTKLSELGYFDINYDYTKLGEYPKISYEIIYVQPSTSRTVFTAVGSLDPSYKLDRKMMMVNEIASTLNEGLLAQLKYGKEVVEETVNRDKDRRFIRSSIANILK